MQSYIDPEWQPSLKRQNLDSFDTLWELDVEWFEPPNIRRGGWSGVSRIEIDVPIRGKVGLFLKRQENHRCKTWQHPFSGIATLEKEFNNILRFKKHNIPSLEPVYFAKKTIGGKIQAILMTEELTGYLPLSDATTSNISQNTDSRQQLLHEVASVMQLMHEQHYQHNCLFPKHLFAKLDDGRWSVKIIDLEKTKYRLFKKQAILRDFSTLHRHATDNWTVSDRISLLRSYMREKKLSNYSKKMMRIIDKIHKQKTTKRNQFITYNRMLHYFKIL